MMNDYICIGVPYSLGKRDDPPNSIDTLREQGIAAELNAEWVDIQPDFDAVDNPVVAVNIALAKTMKAHSDKIPLIFAGDCTSCWGAVCGFQLREQDTAILWYDSHGDFNTPETSPSDFLGGMPLAAMVGLGNEEYVKGIGLSLVQESDIILTDARNLDPEEAELVKNSQVIHLPDINQIMNHPIPEKPLYIHFDVDVVDSAEMPALSYPEPDGPSVDETAATLQHVRQNTNIAGVLFSLYDDLLPESERAQSATLKLVRAITGLKS